MLGMDTSASRRSTLANKKKCTEYVQWMGLDVPKPEFHVYRANKIIKIVTFCNKKSANKIINIISLM